MNFFALLPILLELAQFLIEDSTKSIGGICLQPMIKIVALGVLFVSRERCYPDLLELHLSIRICHVGQSVLWDKGKRERGERVMEPRGGGRTKSIAMKSERYWGALISKLSTRINNSSKRSYSKPKRSSLRVMFVQS